MSNPVTDTPEPRQPGRCCILSSAWLPLLLIVASVALVFGPIVRHQFLAWDDDFTIEANPRIQHPSVENLLYYWQHAYMDLYVPVTYTAWSALAFVARAIGRPGPGGTPDPRFFHAASILVHAFNAALVYWLLSRLLKARWPAAGGALLFALHPMQVEAVAWASGLKDLLCATFSLVALLEYVRAVEPTESGEPARSPARRRLHYALAMAATLLGMLSKPGAIVVPLLIGVVDLLMLRRPWRRVLASAAPFVLLAVPCVIWTKLCQPSDYLRHVPLWQRPIIAADAVAFYLYKLLLPIRLAFDYGRAPWVIFERRWAWFTWMLPAALGLALLFYRRRATPLIAAAMLMVIGVAPVLGFTSFDFQMISTVADHYFYLAMLGPALAAAWLLGRWASRSSSATTATASRRVAFASGIVLAVLAARATDQGRSWQDSRALFEHTLAINPNSWSSWFGLGYIDHTEGKRMMDQVGAQARRGEDPTLTRMEATALLADALECYRRTVKLSEYNVAAHHGYGAMLMFFGRYDEAVDQFQEVVVRRQRLRPIVQAKYFDDTDLLGQCLMDAGRPDEAVRAFRDAVRLDPAPADAAAHLRAAQMVLAQRDKAARSAPAVTDDRIETQTAPAGSD